MESLKRPPTFFSYRSNPAPTVRSCAATRAHGVYFCAAKCTRKNPGQPSCKSLLKSNYISALNRRRYLERNLLFVPSALE